MISHSSRNAAPAPTMSAASTSRAVDAAWVALSQAGSLHELAGPWLTLQMRFSGADGGAVYLLEQSGSAPQARAIAVSGDNPNNDFDTVAAQTFESAKPTLVRPSDTPQIALLGHPTNDGMSDAPVIAAVLRLGDANPQRLRNSARALAWGSAWLRDSLAQTARKDSAQHEMMMRRAHEIFAATIEDHQARRAAIGTVTRLAQAVQADRVSLGFRQRGAARIFAVSHSAEFRKQMALNRRVAAAMDEALDQRAALSHPAPAHEVNATRVQRELSEEDGHAAVLSIPFLIGSVHRGAITFQRHREQPFTENEVAFLDFTTSLVGPVLWDKKQNDKWLIFKISDTIGRQFFRLFGPGYALRKVLILALIGTIALFALWEQPYRVASDAVIEGASQRSLVTPFDGFLREASLRPGDLVQKGDVIAALDDRDMVLERLRWVTERQQKQLELGRAIGEQDRAEAEIFRVQIAQAEAQIALIDARRDRAKLLAPFDGIIVAGDQSQNIGGSVTRGSVLFEVAPIDDYRIVMDVDEARISEIVLGQTGDLIVTALPQSGFAFTVNKITPIAEASEGRNTFRVEALLDPSVQPTEVGLGPGMHGVAKVDVDNRLTIKIWTRELIDWARLTLWKWFG